MAVGKEILTKIRSVQNTQKITKVIQVVSTSKIRKTQDRMRLARPHAEKMRAVMSHLTQTNVDHDIELLELHHEMRRIGFILIISGKSLYGGLDANVLKKLSAQTQGHQRQGIEVEVACLGSEGLAAYQNVGLNVTVSTTNLGDTPKMEALLDPLAEIFQCHEKRGLDRIYMACSRFINTMCQELCMKVLPSIDENVIDGGTSRSSLTQEYLYRPGPIVMLGYLVHRYSESVVYQVLSDNVTPEQAARMVAMRAATDNAGNTIKELRLVHSRSCQVAVTTEPSETVVGTAAVQCRLKPEQETRIR